MEEANALAAREKIKAEEARLRAEQAAREEQERLREIAAKKIPPLPPLPTPKIEQQPTATQPQASVPSASTTAQAPAAPAKPNPSPQSSLQPLAQGRAAAATVNGSATLKPPNSNAFAAPSPTPAPAPKTTTAPTPTPAPHDAKRQRATELHKSLKQLRAAMASQASQNKALKSRSGDLRRELRKVIGQLSLDKDGNKVVVSKCPTYSSEAD